MQPPVVEDLVTAFFFYAQLRWDRVGNGFRSRFCIDGVVVMLLQKLKAGHVLGQVFFRPRLSFFIFSVPFLGRALLLVRWILLHPVVMFVLWP